jgi:superfamily II DNA or RNA helicase
MELRPYQKRAFVAVATAFLDRAVNKQVIVLATGLGKTIIFSEAIRRRVHTTSKKALILAHREELLAQAAEKLQMVDPGLSIGFEQAGRRPDLQHDQVILASVATLGRAKTPRLNDYAPLDFCLLVTDEAHHAANDSYMNVYRHFGVLKSEPEHDWNRDLLHLGVTATPSRTDNKGIDQIYDEMPFAYGLVDGINDRWLARIHAHSVTTHADLSRVKRVAGDFHQRELARAVNTRPRNAAVVNAYTQLTPGKKALCFAVDVAHTKELTECFKARGIPTEYVTGETDKEERRAILARFATRETLVLVNCLVLTEGFDEPSIEVILMARPTQSSILAMQMIGRGTRTFPDKQFLTVVDFVDRAASLESVQTVTSLVGLPARSDCKGRDVLAVKDQLDDLQELDPTMNLEIVDVENLPVLIDKLNFAAGLRVPEPIASVTSFEWHGNRDGTTYHISARRDETILVEQTLTNQFAVTVRRYDPDKRQEQRESLGLFVTLNEAIRHADDHIKANYAEEVVLVDREAKWRREPASPKQLEVLGRMGVAETHLAGLSRGDASRLITKLSAARFMKTAA